MRDDRTRKRLYSEREIGELIQRATEHQENAKESVEHGLTFEEIEHIATEIGIDPRYLKAAAADLENDSGSRAGFRLWGGPFVIEQKRVVVGTVTEEQWEQIVLGLRRATGSSGKITEFGQIREWSRVIKDVNLTLEETRVTISPREDQTTFEIRKQFRGGAFVGYSLSFIFSVTIAGIFLDGSTLSDLTNTMILGSSGLSGFAVARAYASIWVRRQREKLKHLTDWLHDTISQSEDTSSQVLQTAATPTLSLKDVPQSEVSRSKSGVRVYTR